MVGALFQDQGRARPGWQNVVFEVGEVGTLPDRGSGRDRFLVGKQRIAMKIGSWIVERRVAKGEKACDIPVAQHRFLGVDIDREIEEVGNHSYRLAVTRKPAGLQNVDA